MAEAPKKYTITKVPANNEHRFWKRKSDGTAMQGFTVKVKELDKEVQLCRPQSLGTPTVGEIVHAWLNDSPYGQKLNEADKPLTNF